jgi:hypothetical protein
MPEKNHLTARVRLVGLLASIVAVLAIGLTVITGNQNLGGKQTISRSQQVFLLSAAAVLFVMQAALYLIHRRKRGPTKPGGVNDSSRSVS